MRTASIVFMCGYLITELFAPAILANRMASIRQVVGTHHTDFFLHEDGTLNSPVAILFLASILFACLASRKAGVLLPVYFFVSRVWIMLFKRKLPKC